MNLKKFTKNKKQKQILIGSIIGILLIVGGISLYRSFAMYKEEKTFDVLNGTVPDFVYKESILNGAYPVLKSSTGAKLVPVTIDENDGTVRKADIKDEWYKYEDKKWANAVILVDGVAEPKNDEIILEENIESYFVWIPKYRYKIFDMGKYDELEKEGTELQDKGSTTVIDIEFGLENTIDDATNENYKQCATPNASGVDGQCHVGDWMTHPAFTAFPDSKGFWVGKFETGYNQSKEENPKTITVDNSWTEPKAQKDENDSTKVIIKPNVYSWRNITVGNAFKTSYNYQRELDSHMMKNTEWGAVAYLSQSIYGTCKAGKCTEIRINNSLNYVTGVTAKNAPTLGYKEYNDYTQTTPGKDNNQSNVYPRSKDASTTLNNTGIFDMIGGAWECVMGYMYNNTVDKSGLTKASDLTDENSMYFDKYLNTSDTQFNKRILGDATGEMGPFSTKKNNTNTTRINSWYEDYGWFLISDWPWFQRGGDNGDGLTAGVFASGRNPGVVGADGSFRIVLVP